MIYLQYNRCFRAWHRGVHLFFGVFSQAERWSVDMVNHKRTDGDLAALLCALSFATGLGFGGHMEHGLGCASLGLSIADELTLAGEEREAIFYGALLKD